MDKIEYTGKVVILTGKPMERADLGRFVIDLPSIKYHKKKFSVDFDHDEKMPLGYIQNVRFEEGVGLVGEAFLTAKNETSKAYEVIQRLSEGFPFEISPTLSTDSSNIYTVEEGTEIVNGIEVEAPIDVYCNCEFRGVAVVLFGTDPDTSITALKDTKLVMLGKKPGRKCKKENIMTEEKLEIKEEQSKPEYLVLLETMIEEFGEEAGIRYFRQGLTIEDARKADYEDLKTKRAELACKPENIEAGAEVEEADTQAEDSVPAPDSDGTAEKEDLKTELKELKAELTKLRSAISSRGESAPVSASTTKAPDSRDALHKMADKIKARGIKRA